MVILQALEQRLMTVSYTHLIVLVIGIYFFIKERGGGEKEYFLGGRSMGPWVTAMSAQASDMSAWLLMGLPGSILAFGFGQMWIGIGPVSYTHLDVYKRQVYTKSDRLSGIAPEMKAVIAVKEENISFAKEVFEKIKFEICSEYENPEKDLVITLDKYNGEKYQEMLDDLSLIHI